MNVRVGAATDIGQVREGNEDRYLVLEPLYAVADGMGGHRGGEVASHLALDTVQRMFERREGSLADQVAMANSAVFERSQQDRSVSGMGTTLTAALVDGNRVHLVHVGDSRAYLFRDGELTQLTEDHTLVHRMVVEGEISQEEAETHPHRSILTRALGVDPSVQADEDDVVIEDGDRLLLCTDGLTGMVPEDRIRQILAGSDDPQEVVERLVAVANRAGGIDNITAVILEFREDSASSAGTATARSAGPRRSRDDARARSAATGAAPSPARSRPPSRPPSRPRSPRARRVGISAGVAVALLVLALVGARLYLDTQWFVGVSDGRVAIFRGIPAEVAGVELHSAVVETSIPAADAQALPVYEGLADGITAEDRQSADAIVEQIREDVSRAEQPRS